MRKLATIRAISEVRSIPGADEIECAVVDGWSVVVKKGEYQPGDLAVYCEVDSWIPTEIAPFLSKGNEPREYNGIRGERLRTVRLRGQLSQGLVLGLETVFPTATGFAQVGTDVTELMGLQKWEPQIPACLAGQVEGPWPSLVQKTDQERIQNLTSEWARLRYMFYEVTEKLEGSSMTAGRINGKFIVCSRNLNLRETEENSLWQQARRYNIEQQMIDHGLDNLVVQGEIIGEGIQGNYYGIRGQDYYVYDILDLTTGQYLRPRARRALCERLSLKHVPLVMESIPLYDYTVSAVLEMADGQSHLNPKRLREGLVFKQVDGPEHWKAVSNQYLLKM
jgi:RNA ligase (TIGR02306 family)